MAVSEHLRDELKTYEENKDRLVAEHEGKWVVIHDGKVIDIWDTYDDALKAGYEAFGLKTFLVKQIQGIERVQFFTRDIA